MARAKKGSKPKANGDSDLKSTCPCSNEPEDSVYIQCDSCDQWWHCGCVSLGGLLDYMVEVIEEWLCPRCFKSPFVVPTGFVNGDGLDTNACNSIRVYGPSHKFNTTKWHGIFFRHNHVVY